MGCVGMDWNLDCMCLQQFCLAPREGIRNCHIVNYQRIHHSYGTLMISVLDAYAQFLTSVLTSLNNLWHGVACNVMSFFPGFRAQLNKLIRWTSGKCRVLVGLIAIPKRFNEIRIQHSEFQIHY